MAASPVYPGNSGIAFPVFVFISSLTRLLGTNSPSITYSALAIAASSTVKHLTISTGFFLIAPAIDSSLNPIGVVGGSKHDAISIAGSTPILIDIGNGSPLSSAFFLNASKCLTPGVKNIDNSSFPCKHKRWIVTSPSPVSGSLA